MRKYFIDIEWPEGELERIMSELETAQEKILQCYQELKNLGVARVSENKAASGN